jgi:hypothetical protein
MATVVAVSFQGSVTFQQLPHGVVNDTDVPCWNHVTCEVGAACAAVVCPNTAAIDSTATSGSSLLRIVDFMNEPPLVRLVAPDGRSAVTR